MDLKFDSVLDNLQHRSFKYFLHETNLKNGLILDKCAPNWPCSIAATGVGLACYLIGVERGYMTREDAIDRTLRVLRFFHDSPQSKAPHATGYRGFYYHFLDIQTGERAWQSELSTVDTAFLVAGMLASAQYFTSDSPKEQEIRHLAEAIYRRVDWKWALNGGKTLTHGWKPESGFLEFRWEGYDEALLLYILALGSPTFPIPPSSYAAWLSTYQWQNHYGLDYTYAGSFFTHQLSHVWVDFKHIQDAFMQEKGIDYFENSRRATYVQQRYAMENPMNFVGYSDVCWGITASDGPGPDVAMVNGVERQFYDYIGRGVPYGPDDGTIAPWSVVTSLPFAPEIVCPVLEYYIFKLKLNDRFEYGFRSTFNQSHPDKNHPCGWVSAWHFGINEGPVVLMIENHRNGFLWDVMRDCPFIKKGLQQAGFKGGWLT